MSGEFKVGELLAGQNYAYETQYNGMECTAIAPLMPRQWMDARKKRVVWGFVYEVEWANGDTTMTEPHFLRRKNRPAGEELVMGMFKAAATHQSRPA